MHNPPIAQNWMTRLLVTAGGAVILVLGFFFLTIAIVAGIVLAAVIGARLWWRMRKLKRTAPVDDVVEGEYVVVEHETRRRDLPPPH